MSRTKPAFPVRSVNTDDGMSLRDYFAAGAMQEFIRALYTTIAAGTVECESDEAMMEVAAIKSYSMADAMLEARDVSTSPERDND